MPVGGTDPLTNIKSISLTDARSMVPDFDGNSDDLHRFVSCCDLLFSQAKSESDKELFLNLLKTKLTGPAYDLFKYKEIKTWEELKSEINAHFLEHRPRISIQGELLRLKQTPRENLQDFARKVAKHLADLNSVTLQEATEPTARAFLLKENEKNAVRAFEDGIRNEQLRVIVKAHSESNLRKLINFATEHDQRIEENHSNTTRVTNLNNTPFCDYCGRRGHTKVSCFKRRQLPVFPAFPNVKREVNRVTCGYCRKPNHRTHECRRKLQDENSHRRVQFYPQNPTQVLTRNIHGRTNIGEQPRHLKQIRWSTPMDMQTENSFAREESDGETPREIVTQAVIH